MDEVMYQPEANSLNLRSSHNPPKSLAVKPQNASPAFSIRAHASRSDRSGQAIVEYILLLAIVAAMYSLLLNKLSESNAVASMKKPFTQEFTYTYRYGNAKARGQDDGGPTYIPQHHDLEKNFRIFINPPINE